MEGKDKRPKPFRVWATYKMYCCLDLYAFDKRDAVRRAKNEPQKHLMFEDQDCSEMTINHADGLLDDPIDFRPINTAESCFEQDQ